MSSNTPPDADAAELTKSLTFSMIKTTAPKAQASSAVSIPCDDLGSHLRFRLPEIEKGQQLGPAVTTKGE
jgi:hypothetical protein